jgi:SAM-dependent methyltransferase
MSEAVFHAVPLAEPPHIIGNIRIPPQFAPFVTPRSDTGSFAITLPTGFWGNLTNVYSDPRYYSDKHGAYSEGYTLKTRVEKYQDAINTTVNIMRDFPGKYIDFGGGPGYFAYGVAQEAIKKGLMTQEQVSKNIFVADISNIEDGQVKTFGIQRIQSSIAQLPQEYRQGQFMTASCLHTMEHVQNDQILPSIEAMYSALGSGGVLYLIIPTIDGRIQNPENNNLYDQIMLDKTHITLGTRKWWQEQFTKVGFSENPELEKSYDRKNYGWVFCFTKPDKKIISSPTP